MILYLMDENVDPIYRTQILHREPELVVWAVGDEGAPPKSTLDPEILIWCEEHGFILMTNNRTSMPPHLAEHLAQGRHAEVRSQKSEVRSNPTPEVVGLE